MKRLAVFATLLCCAPGASLALEFGCPSYPLEQLVAEADVIFVAEPVADDCERAATACADDPAAVTVYTVTDWLKPARPDRIRTVQFLNPPGAVRPAGNDPIMFGFDRTGIGLLFTQACVNSGETYTRQEVAALLESLR